MMMAETTKILLVEDNPGDARLTREMLAETGGSSFAVDWVHSLSEALEHLARGGIDLVLLDLGLPDSQGLDTFLRAYEPASHLPFLVLTGYADKTLGSTAVRKGAQDFLSKGEVTGSLLHRAIRYAIERKRSEASLAAEHQKLFSLLDELPALVYLKAPDYVIRFANRIFRDTFGTWEGKRCFEVVFSRQEPCQDCPSFTVFKTNRPHQWEWTRPDGTRTFHVHNYPFADTDGSPLVLTLGFDITERKRTEEALRAGEESYRQLFERAGDSLILHDRGRIIEANQEACRSLGYTREELVHKSVLDIEAGLDPELLSRLWEQPDGRVTTLSGFHRRRDGSSFPVEIRAGEVMYYGKKLKLAAARDVTEQQRSLHEIQKLIVDLQIHQAELEQQNEELRRAQVELEASQARYAHLYDFAPMGYFTFDGKGIVVEANLTGAQMLKLERKWLLGSAFLRWVALESRPAFNAHVQTVFNSGAHQTCELDLVPQGGAPFPAALESALVLEGKKEVRYCRTTVTDITQRKQVEAALRESEERFRAIFEQAAVGVAQIETSTGRFIRVNQKYGDIVGLKPEEMTATTFMAITHQDDLQADLDNIQKLREGLIRNFSREKRYIRRDGSLVWVNLTVSPMWDRGQPPNCHIAVVEDITERKRTEEQLFKKTHDLGERVKELNCLYNIARLMGLPNISLDEIIQRVLELIPPAWQYPDLTCASITLEGRTFRSVNFRETQWKQASDIQLHGDCLGRVEVYYRRKKPTLVEGPFLKEEGYLLETIAKTLSVIVEHKQAEKKLRESEQNLRYLASQLLTAQEQEKQKISLELHDTVAQELATLKIDLENLQLYLPEKPVEEFSSRISQLLQKLQRTLSSIRTLAYDLRPPDLEHFGLVQAIKTHCEEFTARTGVKVDFMAAGIEAGHLDDDAAINLYRIIQEGLTNVWRHSQAVNVNIRLVASFPKIILRLEDDGRGFDVMEQEASRHGDKHLGLLGMRERVALLKGNIKIESQLEKGTKISIEIPWKGEDLGTKEEAPHY
jgi:two-component system, NarL family, sensor kinase